MLARVREQTWGLRAEHRKLLDIEYKGQERLKRKPESTLGRDMKAYAREERLKVLAALAVLEDSPITQRVAFLDANPEQRGGHISEVVQAGGLYNDRQQFISVEV